WATTSPPPPENFVGTLPPIRSQRPVWDLNHPGHSTVVLGVAGDGGGDGRGGDGAGPDAPGAGPWPTRRRGRPRGRRGTSCARPTTGRCRGGCSAPSAPSSVSSR